MHLFFDFLIFAFLIVDVVLIVTLVHQGLHIIRRSRPHIVREILAAAVLLAALVAGGIVFYGSFIEPRRITVSYESLVLGEGGERLRVALIGDLHAGYYFDKGFARRIVRRINSEQPEAVLLAGDSISSDIEEARRALLPFVALEASTKLAVLGNHEYLYQAGRSRDLLEELGFRVLVNERNFLGEGEKALSVIGVDDVWFGEVDLKAATAGLPPDAPWILLVHNPDLVYALGEFRPDAILAAHTHGGQIRWPGIGPLAPIPTVLGKDYLRGIFDWAGIPLVITRGLGVTGPRARLFAPPEIMILDIQF